MDTPIVISHETLEEYSKDWTDREKEWVAEQYEEMARYLRAQLEEWVTVA